jgi:hypothetical protein
MVRHRLHHMLNNSLDLNIFKIDPGNPQAVG